MFNLCIFLLQGIVESQASEEKDKKSKEEKKERGDSSLDHQTEQSLKRGGQVSVPSNVLKMEMAGDCRKEKRKREDDERSREEQSTDETTQKQVMDVECLQGDWSLPGRYVCFASPLCKTVPYGYPPRDCTFLN